MKKLLKKLAVLILTSILINIFIIGNTALAATDVLTQAKNTIEGFKDQKCDVTGYPVVIKLYEPMLDDPELGGTTEHKIQRCFEHTITNDPSNKEIGKFTLNTESKQKCKDPDIQGTLYHCIEYQLILSNSGTIVIYTYINTIYRWAATIVGLISVMVIIFSGIQIATSGGETEVLSNAKSRIIKSLSGLAVLFLSGLILYTINPTFFTI